MEEEILGLDDPEILRQVLGDDDPAVVFDDYEYGDDDDYEIGDYYDDYDDPLEPELVDDYDDYDDYEEVIYDYVYEDEPIAPLPIPPPTHPPPPPLPPPTRRPYYPKPEYKPHYPRPHYKPRPYQPKRYPDYHPVTPPPYKPYKPAYHPRPAYEKPRPRPPPHPPINHPPPIRPPNGGQFLSEVEQLLGQAEDSLDYGEPPRLTLTGSLRDALLRNVDEHVETQINRLPGGRVSTKVSITKPGGFGSPLPPVQPARLIDPRRPKRTRRPGLRGPNLIQRPHTTSPKSFSELFDRPTNRPRTSIRHGPTFSEIMGDLLAGKPALPSALLNRRLSRGVSNARPTRSTYANRRMDEDDTQSTEDHPGGINLK